MFVCNYDRKIFIDDHRQKYVEITKNCLGNEIADKRLRFLQTKHLQCTSVVTSTRDISIGDEAPALQSEPMSDDKIILEKLQQIKRAKLIAKAREKKSDLKALKNEN